MFFHVISKAVSLSEKYVLDKNVCVLILFANFSETFLILRRIQQDIAINVNRSSVNYLLFLYEFDQS